MCVWLFVSIQGSLPSPIGFWSFVLPPKDGLGTPFSKSGLSDVWQQVLTHLWDLFSNLSFLQFSNLFSPNLFSFFFFARVFWGTFERVYRWRCWLNWQFTLVLIKQKRILKNLEKINWRIGEKKIEKRSHEWVTWYLLRFTHL